MSAEARTLGYISITAAAISERLTRDSEQQVDVDVGRLSEDVAWLARNLALLADVIHHPEPR